MEKLMKSTVYMALLAMLALGMEMANARLVTVDIQDVAKTDMVKAFKTYYGETIPVKEIPTINRVMIPLDSIIDLLEMAEIRTKDGSVFRPGDIDEVVIRISKGTIAKGQTGKSKVGKAKPKSRHPHGEDQLNPFERAPHTPQ